MNLSFLHKEISSFHAAALILGGAALSSRLLGLLRDRLLAARFGAGSELDIYYAAFQIPDILYTIFLVGAASAAVLPIFLEYDRRSREEAEVFVSRLLTIFAVVATIITILAMVCAPWLARIVAPGFGEVERAAMVSLTRVMMANAVLLGIAGILSSVLQARHRFFVFSLPPVVYNVGIILGILFLVPGLGASGLAYGVVLGGVFQILVQVPAFREMQFRFVPRFSFGDPGIRRVALTSAPRVVALTLSQITLVVLTAITSFFASGSISVLKFAANLLYVPVGLFGISYALAIFPKLSVASIAGEGKIFREHIAAGIRTILFWAFPAAALFIVLRAHLVRVVLGSGMFDWEDTRLVAALLALFALAVISESILPLILRAFYALGKTREPLLWSVAGSVLTIALAVVLSWWFASNPDALSAFAGFLRVGDLPRPMVLVVGVAFSLGSLSTVLFLLSALRRASAERFHIRISFEGSTVLRMFTAAAVAGVCAYVTLLPFPAIVATNTFLGIALQGLAGGAAGMGVYFLLLWFQRNPEVLALVESFQQRLIAPARTPQVYETEKVDGESSK